MSEAMRLLAELRRQGVIPAGISADSRQVSAGEIFVALPGVRSDGRAYSAAAVARGAAAVLREDAGAGNDPQSIAVPNIAVANLRKLSGELASLTHDHLDFHGSMESYATAKAKLFELPGLKAVVLNLDDAFGVQLGVRLAGKGLRRIGYTLNDAAAASVTAAADEVLTTQNLKVTGQGLSFAVRSAQDEARVATTLL